MTGDEAETITKKELVNRIADRTRQTKVVVKDILQIFLDEIVAELARGNRLEFREFGVFEVRQRAPRVAQNPRTLEKVAVPSRRVVKFKVGSMMRDAVDAAKTPAVEPPAPRPPAPVVRPAPRPPSSDSPF